MQVSATNENSKVFTYTIAGLFLTAVVGVVAALVPDDDIENSFASSGPETSNLVKPEVIPKIKFITEQQLVLGDPTNYGLDPKPFKNSNITALEKQFVEYYSDGNKVLMTSLGKVDFNSVREVPVSEIEFINNDDHGTHVSNPDALLTFSLTNGSDILVKVVKGPDGAPVFGKAYLYFESTELSFLVVENSPLEGMDSLRKAKSKLEPALMPEMP